MQTVIVTGASGFIGRHLVFELSKENVEIYAIVRNASCSRKLLPESKRVHIIEYIENSDGSICVDVPENVDIMYHLAWIGFKPEYRKHFDTQCKNIPLTLSYLRLAKEKKVRKIVMVGSTNEYLYSGKIINKETLPHPSDDYGAVKTAIRYLAERFAKDNAIAFNYAVITGIYASDRKDNNIIFYTIDKLLNGEKPLVTKLEQIWDYVYIDDVIEALILIGKKGINGTLYAVGHGDNWPLRNYVEIIHKIINPLLPLGIGEVPYTSNVLPMSCIDLTDIKKDIGFEPKVNFEDGIMKVITNLKKEKINSLL